MFRFFEDSTGCAELNGRRGLVVQVIEDKEAQESAIDGSSQLCRIKFMNGGELTVSEEVLSPLPSRYATPKTVRQAFERAAVLYYADGKPDGINLSSIATKLIQDAGRFCERFASDLLIDWKDIEKLVQTAAEPDDSIIVVALRRHGVDHTEYFMHQLAESQSFPWGYVMPENKYRRIFGVQVVALGDGYVKVILKDITDQFTCIDPEDQNWIKAGCL